MKNQSTYVYLRNTNEYNENNAIDKIKLWKRENHGESIGYKFITIYWKISK